MQLGFAILHIDETKHVNWLSFTRYGCRFLFRSVLPGEAYAFEN